MPWNLPLSKISNASCTAEPKPVTVTETSPAPDSVGLFDRYTFRGNITLPEGEEISAYVDALVANTEKKLRGDNFQIETVNNQTNIFFIRYKDNHFEGTVFIMAKRLEGTRYEISFKIQESEQTGG